MKKKTKKTMTWPVVMCNEMYLKTEVDGIPTKFYGDQGL